MVVEVEKIYPKENRILAENILLNNGLLISENEPGSFVNKNMFVLRDRLQSALSDAVFPIETDIKGGTMHTVGYTIEYQKPIYCPDLQVIKGYDIYNSKAQGVLHLIREGKAKAYTSSDYPDIYKKITGNEIDLPEVKIIDEKINSKLDNKPSKYLFDLKEFTIEKPKKEKVLRKITKETKKKGLKRSERKSNGKKIIENDKKGDS